MGGGICSRETDRRRPSFVGLNGPGLFTAVLTPCQWTCPACRPQAHKSPRSPSWPALELFGLINTHFLPSGCNSWIPFCLANLQPCAGNFPPRHMRRALPSLNYRKLSASARGWETWTERGAGGRSVCACDLLDGGRGGKERAGMRARFPRAGRGGQSHASPAKRGRCVVDCHAHWWLIYRWAARHLRGPCPIARTGE